jgi:hypothetical protein
MSRSYELDANAAKRADEKSSRIDVTGEYIGIFKYAIAVRSSGKGTEGVELHFESNNKQDARISLWTHKASGETLSGFNVLQAIMTCLKLHGIKTAAQQVEVFEGGSKVKKQVDVYPDLMGKPVGLLLQLAPEEYEKDGAIKIANKLDLYGVFQPGSRLVASEILARSTSPERLEKMKSVLKDRPLKKLAGGSRSATTSGGSAGGSLDDAFEDDIPF